jgi:hypothetical protein
MRTGAGTSPAPTAHNWSDPMTPLGRVVRLQIQSASLKRGERPNRIYDPSPLRTVRTLRLTPRGAVGITEKGEALLDVHHRDHHASKHESGREVSFGFTTHYGKMRGQYGERVEIGCAGENILVEADRVYRLEDFDAGLELRSEASGETVRLDAVTVADPCVEFSRFSLGDPAASPQDLKPVLQFLGEGTRGYCFTPAGEIVIAPGDLLVAV